MQNIKLKFKKLKDSQWYNYFLKISIFFSSFFIYKYPILSPFYLI